MEEGGWALGVRSLPQGKPRNDTCSLPLTSDLSLRPSLPLLSFLSPNSQKSNLYPGLFSLFYLYFLKHLMLWIVWINECVRGLMRAQTKASHALMSIKIMRASVRLVRARLISTFPVSDHSSRGKVETRVCLCSHVEEASGAGKHEKLLTWWFYQQTPASSWRVLLDRSVFSVLCTVISQTEVCARARVCVYLCTHTPAWIFAFLYRKQYV